MGPTAKKNDAYDELMLRKMEIEMEMQMRREEEERNRFKIDPIHLQDISNTFSSWIAKNKDDRWYANDDHWDVLSDTPYIKTIMEVLLNKSVKKGRPKKEKKNDELPDELFEV